MYFPQKNRIHCFRLSLSLSVPIAGMLFELYTDIIAARCESELFVSLKFNTITRIDIYR